MLHNLDVHNYNMCILLLLHATSVFPLCKGREKIVTYSNLYSSLQGNLSGNFSKY